MSRHAPEAHLFERDVLKELGLSTSMIIGAITYVNEIIDNIDAELMKAGGERIAALVELANLSAIIGNLFRSGIVRHSNGKFTANAPHTYPDLLGTDGAVDLEIKVALESNKPKGHLVKPGPHLIVRYVLGDDEKGYVHGKTNRGDIPWIWEVRVGHLEELHFNFSNTEGDSGKTAVINSAGMNNLSIVYFDFQHCPLARKNSDYKMVLAEVSSEIIQALL